MRTLTALTALTLLLANPALASEWTTDATRSQISFSGTQSGQPFTGTLPGFSAHITFDPEVMTGNKVDVTIPLATASTGSPMIDSDLPKPEWLDASTTPEAKFSADKFSKTGEHDYVAHGSLTLRGVSVPVDLPFSLTLEDNEARAQGEVTLDRLAFGVGKSYGEGSEVGTKVTVKVDLVATKAP